MKIARCRKLSSLVLPASLLLLSACGGGSEGESPQAAIQQAGESPRAKALAAGVADSEAALTPLSARASNSERGDLSADKAIDGSFESRWSSGFSDAEYLVLDYGKTVTINRVRIDWERAHATAYELQVSQDGSNWTTFKTVSASQGGTEDWGGLSGSGRYLRMQGIKRSSNYGYSIFEIKAYSGLAPAPAPAPAPSPDPTPAPSPAPSPAPIDTSKPGVAIKPVTATSSKVEGGNAAALATDGNAGTRWASAFEDGAYIQFDFGTKTQVGYMKLVWENAYGKVYSLRTSDDGVNWTLLRHVGNGRGGTEEFFNLNANARYIRLQGETRATQYGYSLFEVEFKTPGSDNTLPTIATSALPFPANGGGMVPLPASAEPLESLQFTLADGTLVTRFGVRGLARHGRERGEEWNEIGYGPNETVDAAGNPVNKAPGAFLNFVPQYFKNRTWGFEIIDNSRVAGVKTPTLRVNQYFSQLQLPGGVAWFRAFDRPGVTGYGWMNPGELSNPNITLCPPVSYPPNGKLLNTTVLNNGCSLTVKEYPGHAALGADGFPNGKDVPARPLVLGDVIEVSPSFFSTREAMSAMGDNGGIRYYAGEWTYVVGTGLRPSYGVQPRLMNAPLPVATLSGGSGSVSYNYSDEGLFMFQQPHNNIGMQNMQRFVEGRRLVHTNFTTGHHNEPDNDRYIPAVGLQGSRFNQSACIGCHVNNGRSPAPTAIHQRLDMMSVRAATIDASGRQLPHPTYGSSILMNAQSASGAPQDWGTGVRVAGFETRTVTFADGASVELRKPTLAFDGPAPPVFSLRSAQPMIGAGLLEAIPEADILALARATPDADGVKGVPNYVFDPETGAVRLGRFGWKASKVSLRHQSAAALLQDMAVTSPVYPSRACNAGPAACRSAVPEKGVSEAELQSISRYLALVGVPAQRSLASGFPKGVAPLDEHRVDELQVSMGSKLFEQAKCTACHTAALKTGPGHLFAELRSQSIKPYTDLLLHDMGPGLADGYTEGQATGSMWRTPALWGIGYTDKVMGNSANVGYLHDGRARNLTEAIMWHGGEGEKSRQRFQQMTKTDREALLAFLRSL